MRELETSVGDLLQNSPHVSVEQLTRGSVIFRIVTSNLVSTFFLKYTDDVCSPSVRDDFRANQFEVGIRLRNDAESGGNIKRVRMSVFP